LHEKAELNAPKCRVMNGKGIVSGGQRGVESHETGGKVDKKAGRKSCKVINLEKLNDAKCTI